MGRRKKVNKEEDLLFDKNDEYDQADVIRIIRVYHLALDAGEITVVQDMLDQIYNLTEKYVYKMLWTNCRALMQNISWREEVVQEVWIKIFSEIRNYNPEKGAITTFMKPWIRHVISDYTSRNFRKTSVYYSNNMTKVSGAQNYAKQFGMDPTDTDTLASLTGLSAATVKNTLELMARKDTVSYEAITNAGADFTSRIKGPEESIMEAEAERNLRGILEEVLDDEEKRLLELLLTPENPSKSHSSYREMVEQIPGSNVPKIKRKISKIITKLKNDRRFAQMYPSIIAQEKALEEGYIPVLDNDDDLSEIEEQYAEFAAEGGKK